MEFYKKIFFIIKITQRYDCTVKVDLWFQKLWIFVEKEIWPDNIQNHTEIQNADVYFPNIMTC